MEIRRLLLACLLLLFFSTEPLIPKDWVDTAKAYVGQVEKGNNRGIADKFNLVTGAPMGSPWCAGFVSYCLKVSKEATLKLVSARSKSFIVPGRAVRAELATNMDLRGYIVVWTRTGGGHIGFVKEWRGKSGTTIEGNTSPGVATGSEWNGGGIYIKKRKITPFSAFRITHFVKVD